MLSFKSWNLDAKQIDANKASLHLLHDLLFFVEIFAKYIENLVLSILLNHVTLQKIKSSNIYL